MEQRAARGRFDTDQAPSREGEPASGGGALPHGASAPWLRELRRGSWDLAVELNYAAQTVDIEFLSFLRINSQLGFFMFGPVTIDVRLVEDVFYRTAPRGAGGPEHPPLSDSYWRFSTRVVEEMHRGGRDHFSELTYLLAFMRTPEGLPARVFGELGVTPEEVERYATGLAGRTPADERAERLFSTEQAAEYYGVHVQTVRAWIRAGKLPASKLAGQKSIRIRESDLKRVLEPMEPGAPTAEA